MAKAKRLLDPKHPAAAKSIGERLANVDVVQAGILNTQQRILNQIAALEEAICPRVAARLTALERTAAGGQIKGYLELVERVAKLETGKDTLISAFKALEGKVSASSLHGRTNNIFADAKSKNHETIKATLQDYMHLRRVAREMVEAWKGFVGGDGTRFLKAVAALEKAL